MRLKGMTKAAVAKELGIKDIGRLKVWMRKYKQQGEFGLVDTRVTQYRVRDTWLYLSAIKDLCFKPSPRHLKRKRT